MVLSRVGSVFFFARDGCDVCIVYRGSWSSWNTKACVVVFVPLPHLSLERHFPSVRFHAVGNRVAATIRNATKSAEKAFALSICIQLKHQDVTAFDWSIEGSVDPLSVVHYSTLSTAHPSSSRDDKKHVGALTRINPQIVISSILWISPLGLALAYRAQGHVLLRRDK